MKTALLGLLEVPGGMPPGPPSVGENVMGNAPHILSMFLRHFLAGGPLSHQPPYQLPTPQCTLYTDSSPHRYMYLNQQQSD